MARARAERAKERKRTKALVKDMGEGMEGSGQGEERGVLIDFCTSDLLPDIWRRNVLHTQFHSHNCRLRILYIVLDPSTCFGCIHFH